jgi:hypothetical protein
MEKPLNFRLRNKAITTFLVACILAVLMIFYQVIISQVVYNADPSLGRQTSSLLF